MMDIVFVNLVKDLAANLDVGPDAAFTETMVSLEKNFIRKTLLGNITLDDFQQVFISPGETGTSQTDNDFTAMIHLASRIVL